MTMYMYHYLDGPEYWFKTAAVANILPGLYYFLLGLVSYVYQMLLDILQSLICYQKRAYIEPSPSLSSYIDISDYPAQRSQEVAYDLVQVIETWQFLFKQVSMQCCKQPDVCQNGKQHKTTQIAHFLAHFYKIDAEID